MYGWHGRLLTVDLTRGEIGVEALAPEFLRKWIGGEGFGAKLLWDHVGPEVNDGLDPANWLIFTSGPLTGTMASSSGRLEIVTKSPLTGIFGDTNSGGHFAPEFKRAGYDAIAITGRAPKPVYLCIRDEAVELKDASHLWGKTVSETDQAIKNELGDREIQVSCIGPAGENLVRFAILVNNLDRAPAWSGVGAVAGSKNLKAVAVRGTGSINIARPADFEAACLDSRKKVRQIPFFPTMRKLGTMHLMRGIYNWGAGQQHNFNITQCSESHLENICGERWAENFVIKELGCHGCELQCTHFCRITEGPYAGLRSEGFEYGATTGYVYSYGSSNMAFAMAATKFCNDYGMDSAEPVYAIAWATDCFKRGIIDTKDTDGLVLDWADERVALELLRKITYRQGFGDILAEGLARAARKIGRGSEYRAQTIKDSFSQETPTRVNYGLALASATATRGADHLKGYPTFAGPPEMATKLFGHPRAGDGHSHEGKAAVTTAFRLAWVIPDMLGTCKFHTRVAHGGVFENDYARMLSAASGMEFTGQDLLHAATRVYTLEHCYNVRLGLGRKDDTLPAMFFDEPLNSGPLKGFCLEREKFEKMLDDYYQYWGWDKKTGIPTKETLAGLELGDVAAALEDKLLGS